MYSVITADQLIHWLFTGTMIFGGIYCLIFLILKVIVWWLEVEPTPMNEVFSWSSCASTFEFLVVGFVMLIVELTKAFAYSTILVFLVFLAINLVLLS